MTHEETQQIAALHALGAASQEEVAELRRHLSDCEECRNAAAELDEAAALVALSLDPVQPPSLVRANILTEIAPPVVPRRAASPWWLRVAAAALLLLLGATAVQWMQTRSALERLDAENAGLRAEKQQLSQTIAALSASGTRTIQLAGQEIAPSANARVFLDAPHRRAFVFFSALPPHAGDKDYQLWIIRSDQVAPQSAGVFRVDQAGSASLVVENLPLDKEIKALAVTLEPKGGVPAPTGRMYLLGS